MPSDGDCRHAQERRDRRDRQAFQFSHHEDSAAPRRKTVQCSPHGRPDYEGPFGIIALDRPARDGIVALANRFLSPLVAPEVHDDTDKPGLLVVRSVRDGVSRLRSPEECFLNEVQGILGLRDEAPCEAVKAIRVRLEQRRESFGLLRREGGRDAGSGPPGHTSLNVCPGRNVGADPVMNAAD